MYVIIDWANNLLFNGKEFETFEDGWDYLYRLFPEDESEFDDYYVIKKTDFISNKLDGM